MRFENSSSDKAWYNPSGISEAGKVVCDTMSAASTRTAFPSIPFSSTQASVACLITPTTTSPDFRVIDVAP
jgi:hypothetical protein